MLTPSRPVRSAAIWARGQQLFRRWSTPPFSSCRVSVTISTLQSCLFLRHRWRLHRLSASEWKNPTDCCRVCRRWNVWPFLAQRIKNVTWRFSVTRSPNPMFELDFWLLVSIFRSKVAGIARTFHSEKQLWKKIIRKIIRKFPTKFSERNKNAEISALKLLVVVWDFWVSIVSQGWSGTPPPKVFWVEAYWPVLKLNPDEFTWEYLFLGSDNKEPELEGDYPLVQNGKKFSQIYAVSFTFSLQQGLKCGAGCRNLFFSVESVTS